MKAVPALLLALACTAVLPAQTATPDARAEEIRLLRQQLQAISQRLDALEHEPSAAAPTPATASTSTAPAPATASATSTAPAPPPVLTADDAPTLTFFRGTTLNLGIDGYYGYNFNAPIGRVNLLRAYDVSSNSFSLNQATIMLEHLPTPAERFGGRIDLQYGQATETLQGSASNEQRPQVYRNLYQAYGSYLAPMAPASTTTSASSRVRSATKATTPRIRSRIRGAIPSITCPSTTWACAPTITSRPRSTSRTGW